jgi:hypothetical protein
MESDYKGKDTRRKKLCKSKWVFKINRNGIFRARLMAFGNSQVPGKDLNERYVPAISDVSSSIILIGMIV